MRAFSTFSRLPHSPSPVDYSELGPGAGVDPLERLEVFISVEEYVFHHTMPYVLPIIISTAVIKISVLTICNYAIELFGLTQQEVARRIGSSTQAVQHWEQGLKIPRPEWLGALAKLYDIEVGTLLNVPPKTKGRRTRRVK